MSEHVVHQWQTFGLVGEAPELFHRVCTVCGAEETYKPDPPKLYTMVDRDALEQLEHRLAEATALLEAAIWHEFDDPGCTSGDPEESQCFFCGGEQDFSYKPPKGVSPWRKEYEHASGCAWVKIHAFLAGVTQQGEEKP